MVDRKDLLIAMKVRENNLLSLLHQRQKLLWKWRVRKRRRMFLMMALMASLKPKRQHRRFPILQRSTNWDFMEKNNTDESWRKDFRMTKATFLKIVDIVRQDLEPDEKAIRKPISVEKRAAIAIYQLASSAEYKTTGNKFQVSKSSVHNCLQRFCKAMVKNITRFIKLPTNAEAIELAEVNQTCYKLPQIWGAIGDCHIHVSPPKRVVADYMNERMFPSIVLQAVFDSQYRFLNISVKMPGSTAVGAVMENSNLYKVSQRVLPEGQITIDGVDIPLMLAGDAAYQLLPWLIKPYVGSSLTEEQILFNCCHNNSRIVVEDTFDRLKSRWRILRKKIASPISQASMVIGTCCILHNICENEKASEPTDFVEAQPTIATLQSPQSNERSLIRDTICRYLANNFPLHQSNRL